MALFAVSGQWAVWPGEKWNFGGWVEVPWSRGGSVEVPWRVEVAGLKMKNQILVIGIWSEGWREKFWTQNYDVMLTSCASVPNDLSENRLVVSQNTWKNQRSYLSSKFFGHLRPTKLTVVSRRDSGTWIFSREFHALPPTSGMLHHKKGQNDMNMSTVPFSSSETNICYTETFVLEPLSWNLLVAVLFQ